MAHLQIDNGASREQNGSQASLDTEGPGPRKFLQYFHFLQGGSTPAIGFSIATGQKKQTKQCLTTEVH